MDDFSEAAEKSLNCKLEQKHVPVSKSTGAYYPKTKLKVFSSTHTDSEKN